MQVEPWRRVSVLSFDYDDPDPPADGCKNSGNEEGKATESIYLYNNHRQYRNGPVVDRDIMGSS